MPAPTRSDATTRRSDEAANASFLMIGVIAVVMAIAVALLGLGAVGVERGRLQAVADLTALATARGDDEGATVARRNGVVLVSTDRSGSMVTVVVERDGQRATAAAEN